MELMCYFLALSLSVLYSPQPATGQGVNSLSLELNGVAVPNFGLLGHSAIDTSNDVDDVGSNLVCRTDNTSCCRNADNPNGGGSGSWYYPDGGMIVFPFEFLLPSGQIYRQQRGTQVVRLYRDGGSGTTTANGIYRCELADQNGVTQTRYVGLYTNAAGAVTVGASLQFAFMDPGSFLLFAVTCGGPPTTFSWRGPDGVLSNADSTVTVQNGRTSQVQLELRVTGNVSGEYTFTATNSRTTGDVTSTLTVTAGTMPTGLMAVQQGAGIRVTWSAPASGPAPTGYVVYYQAGSSGVRTTQTGSTTILLTDNLVNGAEHRIEVAALANIPGERAGPVTVDFLLAPDPPVVTLTDAMATGVTVGWNSQGVVDSYEVLYNRTTGSAQQGACPDFVDMGSATANGGDTSLTLQNIEEFSNYTITVIAMNRIASVGTAVEFLSPSAASSPPSVALVTSTNTTIAVSWTALSCIDQNSQFTIVSYTVRYGRESDSERTTVLVPGTSTAFTVSILEPGTRYSIEVAAVNSNGETGEFSEPIVESTSGAFSCSSSVVAAAIVLGMGLLLSLLLNAATITALVVKCRQGHTTDQQEMTDLSDAKISTAACEAYIDIPSSAHEPGRSAREDPQYEAVSPATGLGGQTQGEPETQNYEQV